jgi:hypothetical protein
VFVAMQVGYFSYHSWNTHTCLSRLFGLLSVVSSSFALSSSWRVYLYSRVSAQIMLCIGYQLTTSSFKLHEHYIFFASLVCQESSSICSCLFRLTQFSFAAYLQYFRGAMRPDGRDILLTYVSRTPPIPVSCALAHVCLKYSLWAITAGILIGSLGSLGAMHADVRSSLFHSHVVAPRRFFLPFFAPL